MRVYPHEGRYYIESRDGTEYAIKVKNNNWWRVEVIAAVDGLSVMNGKLATKSDSGYVVNGYSELIIKGYRKDMEEVGAFKFTRKYNSYAASKGKASNVGVIAIAVYNEKVNWNFNGSYSTTIAMPSWTLGPTFTSNGSTGTYKGLGSELTSTSSSTIYAMNCSNSCVSVKNSAKGQSVDFDHGTTWGQKLQDRVVNVEFERDILSVETEIFYNSKENLEAIGIKLVQEKLVTLPRGFPADFASPPSGWSGY